MRYAILISTTRKGKKMQTVKMSLPGSWLGDVVNDREVQGSLGWDTVWGRLANNYDNRNGRGSLVIDLNETELLEIIDDAYFYSIGHYDADIEQPYKYVMKKAQAKLAELKGTN